MNRIWTPFDIRVLYHLINKLDTLLSYSNTIVHADRSMA